ncbi:KOW motif-containing protein [Streptomyces xantholiticus]|uniref:KOW motif-containing protein n=1 Tax=Streptomyces xantholiticus TaxID=68285 RepID=UPI0016730111|nr:KOW motif-containing protein [Streptomyces xantholiticus]
MPDEANIQIGDAVRVAGGPYADFMGAVRGIDLGRRRVQLTVDILGDASTIDVPLSDVVRAV